MGLLCVGARYIVPLGCRSEFASLPHHARDRASLARAFLATSTLDVVNSSWPILSAVQNANNVDDIACDLVDHYIRQ